jgi:hypothetical protein
MDFIKIKNWFLSGSFLFNRRLAIGLWFGLSLFAILNEIARSELNNYLIYKYVFVHMQERVNIYLDYPSLYEDSNHYGPVFGLVIAPFAMLPDRVGVFLWVMMNTFLLYFAIRKLPIAEKYQNAILILGAHEMMTAAAWLQINPMIAACIIFGFCYINENKNSRALFFILLATFIKIYGVVGFAFFLFTKDKINFIAWAAIWSVLFLAAPILLAPPSFIVQCYKDWYDSLMFKANKNINFIGNDLQDISVMGMLRRIFKMTSLKDSYVVLPALGAFLGQYLQFKHFSDLRFRLYILCSVLLFTVIFSNGSENPTYIIAFPAVCIWYVIQPPAKWINTVFVFALLLTSFSYSDIFTPYVRLKIIRPYSLKALPCFVVWLIITVQVYGKQFLKVDLANGLKLRSVK